MMPNDPLDEIEARSKDVSAIRKAIARISVNSSAYVGYPSPLESLLSGRLLDRIAEEATKVLAADAAALIEMVRARDRMVEAAIRARQSMRLLIREHSNPGTEALAAEWELGRTLAALDTPPAQEPTE